MIAFFRTVLYQPLYNFFLVLVAIMPNHNVALAIIVLTLLVRLILTPLKFKAIESQVHQRDVQGELKEIQKKYKDNKQAQAQAVSQLYKDKGINPASGCLPMLIQLPILIVLYYVFRAGIGPEQGELLYSFIHPVQNINTSFLWLKDITKPDHTFILPVLAGVSQFFYSKSMMASMPTSTGDSKDPADMATMMTKQMTYFFPIFTVVIARTLPAALSIYWVAATLMDWYQQHIGTKRVQRKQATQGKVSVTVRSKKEAKS